MPTIDLKPIIAPPCPSDEWTRPFLKSLSLNLPALSYPHSIVALTGPLIVCPCLTSLHLLTAAITTADVVDHNKYLLKYE